MKQTLERFLNDPEGPRGGLPRSYPPIEVRRQPQPNHHTSSHTSAMRAPIRRSSSSSTASSSSSASRSDGFGPPASIASSASTAPVLSPIPEWYTQLPGQPPVDPDFIQYDYELQCEFVNTGCQVRFHPSQWEFWIRHTLSHFGPAGPPIETVCLFCDGPQSKFTNPRDPVANWWRRMIHIGAHLQNHSQFNHIRPDYPLIKHMYANSLIDNQAFKVAMSYTERPYCSGLVGPDFKTEEMIAKERQQARAEQQPYNIGREDRERRRRRRV